MRIIYFSKGYTIHDYRFLSALANTEHEIHFLRIESNSDIEKSLPIPDVIIPIEWKMGDAKMGDRSRIVLDLKRIIDEVKPDLIHAGPVQSCAYLTALVDFKPLLTMSWGSDILEGARTDPGRSEAIFTLGRSSLFACDCETVAREAQELGMPCDKIVVFPWGVDLKYFTPGKADSLRSDLGWQDKYVLLSTRALEEIYGAEVLLDGFIRAAKGYPKLRLLMLNGGSLQEDMENTLRREKLEDRVNFAGIINLADLPRYYCAADLYVSASRSDGSSISLLEAMASGLPAIVSDIPGNREWVELGKNGWWFKVGEPDSLAEAIIEAIHEPGLLREFGVNARKIAEERANWDVNFQHLLNAYRRINEMCEEIL